jgi:hypothetical protein
MRIRRPNFHILGQHHLTAAGRPAEQSAQQLRAGRRFVLPRHHGFGSLHDVLALLAVHWDTTFATSPTCVLVFGRINDPLGPGPGLLPINLRSDHEDRFIIGHQ